MWEWWSYTHIISVAQEAVPGAESLGGCEPPDRVADRCVGDPIGHLPFQATGTIIALIRKTLFFVNFKSFLPYMAESKLRSSCGRQVGLGWFHIGGALTAVGS